MQIDSQSNDSDFLDERHSGTTVLRSVQLVELRLLKTFDQICTRHGLTYWLDGGTLLGAVRHGGFIPWDDDIDIVMPRADYNSFLQIASHELPADMEIDALDGKQDRHRYNIPCRIRDKHSIIVETRSRDNRARGIFIDIIPSDLFHWDKPRRFLEMTAKVIYRHLLNIYSPPTDDAFHPAAVVNNILDSLSPLVSAETPIKYFHRFVGKFLIRTEFQKRGNGLPGYGFDVRWMRIFRPEYIYPLKRMKFEGMEFFVPNNTDAVLKVFYGQNYMTPPPPDKRGEKHFSSLILDTRVGQDTVHAGNREQ